MSHYRIHVKKEGERYVHVRFFIGETISADHTNVGVLVFEPNEWNELRKLCFSNSSWVEVIEETPA